MAEMPVADDPTSGTSHQAGQQTPPTFGESMADQSKSRKSQMEVAKVWKWVMSSFKGFSRT